MIYTHDAIRQSLERKIRPDPPIQNASYDELVQTEWNPVFEQYMRNRLIMGSFRYERLQEKAKGNKYKCIEYVRTKLLEYEKKGNLECLVDAANLLLIEFTAPHHPQAHFQAEDDTQHVQTF